MTTINTRAKSPTRAEAIAKALRPGPVFCTGVLLGKLYLHISNNEVDKAYSSIQILRLALNLFNPASLITASFLDSNEPFIIYLPN